MRESKFIILTSLQYFTLSFPLLFHVVSTAILKFPPWFLAPLPWFTHFSDFHPDSQHSHADFSHPHFHPLPHILTFILRISLIPFSNSPFWFLQIACSVCTFKELKIENSCFSSKTNIPLFYYCITLGTNLLCTSYMTSSVLSPKIIDLTVPRVKNL